MIHDNKYPPDTTKTRTFHEFMQDMQAHAKTCNATGVFIAFYDEDNFHTYYYGIEKTELEWLVDDLVTWVETMT